MGRALGVGYEAQSGPVGRIPRSGDRSHTRGFPWLAVRPFCWVPAVPAVASPGNIPNTEQSLWLARKNSLGFEAWHMAAFPPVYIFVYNKLPDELLSPSSSRGVWKRAG